MPQPQQHQICAASATYTIAPSSARSLIHWAGPGFESTSSCILVGFMTTEPQGNSRVPFYLQMDIQNLWERPSFPHRITSSPSFMKISAVCVTCIICWMCGSLSTYLYVWPYDGRTGSCFLQSIVKLWPPAFFFENISISLKFFKTACQFLQNCFLGFWLLWIYWLISGQPIS